MQCNKKLCDCGFSIQSCSNRRHAHISIRRRQKQQPAVTLPCGCRAIEFRFIQVKLDRLRESANISVIANHSVPVSQSSIRRYRRSKHLLGHVATCPKGGGASRALWESWTGPYVFLAGAVRSLHSDHDSGGDTFSYRRSGTFSPHGHRR